MCGKPNSLVLRLKKIKNLRKEEEIKNLRPFVYGNVIVNYNLVLTMVDTKICNDLTGTDSAMKCFICGATPRNMNKLDQIFDKTPNSDNYRFGISSLHAWIRTFECLLHIAYNLPFKSWSARGENKKIKEDRMLKIQEEFRSKTGLLVDIVKQGAGKTNDGNTARRFFSEYKTSAQITGLNEDLIKRLFVILQVIASGLHINVDAFKQYTRETADLYVSLYDWYYMPVTLHKILIHGADIISHHSIIGIGQLSEDAQEANHKVFRYQRLHHTRKTSRISTNSDLIRSLILLSDPVLASHIVRRERKTLLKDAQLLINDNDSCIEYEDE